MRKYGKPELRAARRKGLGLLGAVFVFSVFVNALMLTGPLFMLQVYDRVLGSRSEETLVSLSILVAVLFALMGLLDYARGRVLARFGARFQANLDKRVFDAVMRRAIVPKDRSSPSSGLRDLEIVQTLFTSPAMLAVFDVPWTPLFIAGIFIFHPILGWAALSGGLVLIVVTLLNNWLTARKVATGQSATQSAHGFAEQARNLAEVVRAQGMSAAISRRWLKMRNQSLEQTVAASDWTGIFTAFTKSFRMFLQSAMLAIGAWLVLQQELTAGAMIAGSILLGRALAPLEQTIGQWPMVQKSFSSWRRLGQLLESAPPDGDLAPLPKPSARLEAKDLTISAGKGGNPILARVSITAEPGQALGIIGKSGSGKTTLAKALLGLVKPSLGEVRLGGATLEQYNPDDLGGFVGYLPQHVSLFSGTVSENIARMIEEPDIAKVVAAAKRARAHDMILALPDGYETEVQGQDSLLSGGQRQRIALARALYDDPVMLILDEPNSALDAEGSEALNTAVRDFKSSNRSVVIMTHRPAAIAECDRLAVLDNGKVVAQGPRDEIIQKTLRNSSNIHSTISKAQAS